MKKRICLIITIFILALVFCYRVNAETVMYFECEYDSYEEVNFNIAFRATSNSRFTSTNATYHDAFGGYGKYEGRENIIGVQDDYHLSHHETDDYCWINKSSDIDNNCDIDNNAKSHEFKLQEKICPAAIRYTREIGFSPKVYDIHYALNLVLAGEKPAKNVSSITEDEYIVYRIFSDELNKPIYVFEAYRADGGQYFYINRNFSRSFNETFKDSTFKVDQYQLLSILKAGNRGDYWKLSSNFNALYPYVSGYCSDKNDCENNKNFEVIFSSGKDDKKLDKYINDWYKKQGNKYTAAQELTSLVNNNNFISTCNDIVDNYEKGITKYSFSENYSASQFLTELEKAYNSLKTTNGIKLSYTNYHTGEENVDAYNSAITFVYSNAFQKKSFKELYEEESDAADILDETSEGDYIIETMINKDIKEKVNNIFGSYDPSSVNSLEIIMELNKYNELFTKTTLYFNEMLNNIPFNENEIKRLNDLAFNVKEFANEHNISIILSCEDLISDELNEKILSYFKIIRIAIPILLIGYGIIDFTKAFFSSDESAMKKAQSQFIKRVFISILFFFVPIIVDLLLNVSNRVWDIINPDTCIRF